MMNINEFDRFNSFLGYGNSKNPEVVFFGLEEGAGQDDFTENLNYRIKNIGGQTFKDLYKFHTDHFAPKSMQRWFKSVGHVEIQRTWTRYCALMLSLEGQGIDITNRRLYQENKLGRIDEKTLLIERYPLPRTNHKIWDDQLNVPELFTSKKEYFQYMDNVDSKRKDLLINLLKRKDFCPKAIIIHGSNAVKGILNFFENDTDLNLSLSPIPIQNLPIPEKWNYFNWKKQNGTVKFIFMPFIQGSRGLSIEIETHLAELGRWIAKSHS